MKPPRQPHLSPVPLPERFARNTFQDTGTKRRSPKYEIKAAAVFIDIDLTSQLGGDENPALIIDNVLVLTC